MLRVKYLCPEFSIIVKGYWGEKKYNMQETCGYKLAQLCSLPQTKVEDDSTDTKEVKLGWGMGIEDFYQKKKKKVKE